jgi:hypothetical protein
VQRTAVCAARDLLVGAARLLERQLLRQRDHTLEFGPVLFQPVDVHAREIEGGHSTRLQQPRQSRDRPEGELLQVGRDAVDFRRASAPHPSHDLGGLTRRDGLEVERRGHTVGYLHLTDRLEAAQVLVQALQHELALLVGELESRNRLRLIEHLLRNARLLLLLQSRP